MGRCVRPGKYATSGRNILTKSEKTSEIAHDGYFVRRQKQNIKMPGI